MANSTLMASAIILGVGVVILLFLWRLGSTLQQIQHANQKDDSLLLLQNQINSLRGQVETSIDRLRTNVTTELTHITGQVGNRLDSATTVIGSLQRQLGELEQANQRILEVGKDIASLQEILKPPKMRGGVGESLLKNLLGQILPHKEYCSFEYSFKSGERVDAVINIGNRMVPVDSKFPLESFKRITEAKADEERARSRREFERDVKNHIDAIARKYILPDEGTYEFALMYIPAENVYYETIIKDENSGREGIFEHALNRKVIPVSPNSFYAYLQVIILGLKGLAIEKSTKEILATLQRLQGDFSRFSEDFRKIGGHISNAQSSFGNAEKRLLQLGTKLKQIENPKEHEAQAHR
jgi:DNA recombination protein RmuC